MTVSNISKRRWTIRLLIIAALVGIAFWMYDIGKEYNVLVDNETVTIDGKEYPTVEYADLVVDGDEKKPLSFEADDRLVQKMVGKGHTLRVNILKDDQETLVKTIERHIKLNVDTRAWMISLPAVVGEAPNIFIPNPLFSEEGEKPAPSSSQEETPGTDDPTAVPTE